MTKTFSDEAIVLRAFDIGEADRLYILLTAQHGRLAVRAGGVRRPLSRLGGHLSALTRVQIQCSESATGYRLTSALSSAPLHPAQAPTPVEWCAASETVELLMRLTEENTPLPGIFELFADYLEGGDWLTRQALFNARLLHALGHLPLEPGEQDLRGLSLESQSALFESLAGFGEKESSLSPAIAREIGNLLERIIPPLLSRPLRAQEVRVSIAAEPSRRFAV